MSLFISIIRFVEFRAAKFAVIGYVSQAGLIFRRPLEENKLITTTATTDAAAAATTIATITGAKGSALASL